MGKKGFFYLLLFIFVDSVVKYRWRGSVLHIVLIKHCLNKKIYKIAFLGPFGLREPPNVPN